MYLRNGSTTDPERIPLLSSTETIATQAGPSNSLRNTTQKQPQCGHTHSDPLEQQCHDLEDKRTRLMDQLHMQELESEVEVLHEHAVHQQASTSEILESIIGGSIATKRIHAEPSDSDRSDGDTIEPCRSQLSGYKVEKP